MEGVDKYINISIDEMKTTAKKYKKDLMMLPVFTMEDLRPHFSFNFGIRYKESRSLLKGKAKFGPYKTDKSNKLDLDLGTEMLETSLGNCVENFDPNSLVETIWGEDVVQGEAMKRGEMVLRVLSLLHKGVGEDLRDAIFTAKRDKDGESADTLFDGFIKRTTDAITAGKIAADKGNLLDVAVITSENALDVLKEFYRKADRKLKKQTTYLYVPTHVLEKLQDDYAVTRAANQYNTKFEQVVLEGSQGKCTVVAMDMMPDEEFIYLAPRENMNINFNLRGGVNETMNVDRFSSFTLTFSYATFFGVGFKSFEKEFLLVGKIKKGGE